MKVNFCLAAVVKFWSGCLMLMLVSHLVTSTSLAAAANSTAPPPKLVTPSLSPTTGSASIKSAATAATNILTGADIGNDKVATLPTRTADQKTELVLNSLAKQAGWFPNVRISVTDGMVSISGSVKNAEQIEWLAKTADRLPGVIAVINKTELEQLPFTDLTPAWQELHKLIESGKKSLPLALFAALLMGFFFFLARYISLALRSVWGKHISNPFLLATVARLTMLPIWAIFFYLTLRTAGLSGLATTIIGGTGAASLIIGFAFKGIAENYLSGLLLAIRSPFTKGDEIQVDKYTGFVQSLNMRGTTIIDYEGNVVLIPNSIVIQSVIRNRTTNSSTRSSFVISISYTDSVGRAQELIGGIIKVRPDVLVKPGPSVVVDKLSPSGIDLAVYFWFDALKANGDRIKSALVGQIKDQLLASGFHIPDTAREILFVDTLKIHMLQSEQEADATDQKRGAAVRAKATAQLQDQPPLEKRPKDGENQDVRALAEDKSILKKSVHSDLLQPE